MSNIIDLGCDVADVHHRYHQVHGALFGAAAFRLVIDALRGKRRRRYKQFSQALNELRERLFTLETQIQDQQPQGLATGTDRELRQVLLEYTLALSKTIAGLESICRNLEDDESAYRDSGDDGRSRFARDKLHYDHLLSELERLGTRLNRLFSDY